MQSIRWGMIRIPNDDQFDTNALGASRRPTTQWYWSAGENVNEYSIEYREKCSTETVAQWFREHQIKVKLRDFLLSFPHPHKFD